MHRTQAQTLKPLPMGLRHFSNFQFPAPQSKFINPHLKVHMTIFEAQKYLMSLKNAERKRNFMSTPSLPEMGTQAVLELCP
jgi:hypothetical protein